MNGIQAAFVQGFTLIGGGMCRCDVCDKEIMFSYPAIVSHRRGNVHKAALATSASSEALV